MPIPTIHLWTMLTILEESFYLKIKDFLKKKYNKPGDAYLGVIHRLDRPTSGVVIFAKTSKALTRLNEQFKERMVDKKYWAITEKNNEAKFGKLENWILKNSKQFGLIGIKERIQSLKGTFDLQTSPSKGTSLIILIPRR